MAQRDADKKQRLHSHHSHRHYERQWRRQLHTVIPNTTPPYPAVLPYSNTVLDLITHQVLAQDYGYVIRREATVRELLQTSHCYLYHRGYRRVKRNLTKSTNFLPILPPQGEKMSKWGMFC